MERQHLRLMLTGLLSSFLASLSIAGIEFFPHYGYPSPVYFSGTNSRAFYRVQVTAPHNHIAKLEIYLNNMPTLVLNTPVLPGGGGGGEPGQGTGLIAVQEGAVMFDSFYYSLGTQSITVKCRVLAESQPSGAQEWFEHTYSAPAKNKAAIFSLFGTGSRRGTQRRLRHQVGVSSSLAPFLGHMALRMDPRRLCRPAA